MLNQSQLTIQLSPAAISRIAKFARNRNLSNESLVEEVLTQYLDHMTWLEVEVEKGRQDIREGRFHTHEEVGEMLRKMGVNLD